MASNAATATSGSWFQEKILLGMRPVEYLRSL